MPPRPASLSVIVPVNLSHMSGTELEGLVTALEAVLDGEGTPMPPLTGS
jgi:hypothetical protein